MIMSAHVAQPIPTMNHTHPLPPRYSSLEGALSPEAASILRSLRAKAGHTLSDADNSHSGYGSRDIYPPRYSGVCQRPDSSARQHHRHRRMDGNNYSRDSQLAAGSQPFEYHIRTNRDQPWATLKVFSRSSSTSTPSSTVVAPGKMPKFTSKDLVQGCLELNLDSPQSINSISLSVSCLPH
jgi:hypothetical protein